MVQSSFSMLRFWCLAALSLVLTRAVDAGDECRPDAEFPLTTAQNEDWCVTLVGTFDQSRPGIAVSPRAGETCSNSDADLRRTVINGAVMKLEYFYENRIFESCQTSDGDALPIRCTNTGYQVEVALEQGDTAREFVFKCHGADLSFWNLECERFLQSAVDISSGWGLSLKAHQRDLGGGRVALVISVEGSSGAEEKIRGNLLIVAAAAVSVVVITGAVTLAVAHKPTWNTVALRHMTTALGFLLLLAGCIVMGVSPRLNSARCDGIPNGYMWTLVFVLQIMLFVGRTLYLLPTLVWVSFRTRSHDNFVSSWFLVAAVPIVAFLSAHVLQLFDATVEHLGAAFGGCHMRIEDENREKCYQIDSAFPYFYLSSMLLTLTGAHAIFCAQSLELLACSKCQIARRGAGLSSKMLSANAAAVYLGIAGAIAFASFFWSQNDGWIVFCVLAACASWFLFFVALRRIAPFAKDTWDVKALCVWMLRLFSHPSGLFLAAVALACSLTFAITFPADGRGSGTTAPVFFAFGAVLYFVLLGNLIAVLVVALKKISADDDDGHAAMVERRSPLQIHQVMSFVCAGLCVIAWPLLALLLLSGVEAGSFILFGLPAMLALIAVCTLYLLFRAINKGSINVSEPLSRYFAYGFIFYCTLMFLGGFGAFLSFMTLMPSPLLPGIAVLGSLFICVNSIWMWFSFHQQLRLQKEAITNNPSRNSVEPGTETDNGTDSSSGSSDQSVCASDFQFFNETDESVNTED